jgi:Coenzyme PQQ synthesis protein D (PqqD)
MSRFVRSDSVVSRVIANETLIVPVRRGVGDLSSIYSLNPVASTIWEALAQPRSKEEIVRLIEKKFDVPSGVAPFDVDSFLAEMTATGLANAVEVEVAA